MAEFTSEYARDKSGQGRLLKAKFSVRRVLLLFAQFLSLCVFPAFPVTLHSALVITFSSWATLNIHTITQAFNTGLDALLVQQGEWRVASAGLRDRLSAMMVTKIVDVYTNFFNTYSIVKFSKKHMDEYLKYPPNVAKQHLTGFFGRA